MTCTEELMAAEKYASPPGAVLVIIHQMKLMLAWWYTCSSVTFTAPTRHVSATQWHGQERRPHLVQVALEQHDEGVHELVDLADKEDVDHGGHAVLAGLVRVAPHDVAPLVRVICHAARRGGARACSATTQDASGERDRGPGRAR